MVEEDDDGKEDKDEEGLRGWRGIKKEEDKAD